MVGSWFVRLMVCLFACSIVCSLDRVVVYLLMCLRACWSVCLVVSLFGCLSVHVFALLFV